MTQFVDTGRPGKKRYRVRFQGVGGSRTAEFAHINDACREYYRREREIWEQLSGNEVERKKPMSIRGLVIFYFGKICEDFETNNIGKDYFRGQTSIFNAMMALWKGSRLAVKDVRASDIDEKIKVENHKIFMKRAFDLAVSVGISNVNPCKIKNTTRKASWKSITKKCASQKEVDRLIALDNPVWRFAVYLAAACGLRKGEVAAVTWNNISENSLIIDKRLTPSGIQQGLKYGVDNCLPITPEFHRMLANVPRGKSQYVFESNRGTHFSNAGFYQAIIKPAFAGVGMKKNFHSLRHYAVSVWAERGISIVEISQWLGHASPEITLKIYAHLFKPSGGACYLRDPT